MTRKTVAGTAAVAALMVGLGVLAAAAANEPAPKKLGGKVSADVTYTEDDWTITTPNGWTRKVWTDRSDAETAVRYEGPNGEYFIVAIDPLGSDYASDTVWNYKVVDGQFEIVARNDEADDNDDRYDGILIWKSGTDPVRAGGHVYYFMFGDEDSAEADEELFAKIAASMKAK